MGSVYHQISLLRTLKAFELAEGAAALFDVPGQQAKADVLHTELMRRALACGFSPGGIHAHMGLREWCHHRAAVLARVIPNHLQQEGL